MTPSLHRTQRGAALLLAMMVMVLVTTAATGMVWLQTRATQVEAAERARTQAGWILTGALDWARLILREDFRTGQQRGRGYDSLDEPWATPLAEARLSTFLAADADHNADDGPEAFLSGGIVDAQSRFNLRGLIDGNGKPLPAQVAALERLAARVGVPPETAARIAAAMSLAAAPAAQDAAPAPLKPRQLSDLAWLGIEPAILAQLSPWVDLLDVATPVNVNTASREVLVAAIDGLDLGSAERLVQVRQRRPFQNLGDVQALLPSAAIKLESERIGVSSNWFEVYGRLRLDDRVIEERTLLRRDGERLTPRRSERRSLDTAEVGSVR